MPARRTSAPADSPYVTTRAPAARAAATKSGAEASSALTTALFGHAPFPPAPPGPFRGFASPAWRAAKRRIFAARYASNVPWNSRCSCVTFVRMAASYATPATRSAARPCDVVSTTAHRSPAFAIARSRRCISGASGVVAWTGFATSRPPTRSTAVLDIPVRTPAVSRAETTRRLVDVFPSVPVTPTTARRWLGSSYHQHAAVARARRLSSTTSCGTARPGSGRSTTTAAAPAATAPGAIA